MADLNRNKRKKLVQFGAGNIGRSFIGQLFGRNGWEIVFIDINDIVVDALNQRGEYRIYVKATGKEDQILIVPNVRAVNGKDEETVVEEIKNADMVCTSVGSGVLPYILPVIAEAIVQRENVLDLVLAENIRNGADFVRKILKEHLPDLFPLNKKVGLVETSIGKMVPIMRAEDVERDPLAVFAETYNNLIVDKRGFLNSVPDFKELKPVENIAAYVDRKLFIHNLGHAASAYLGYAYNENFTYIWQALEVDNIYNKVRKAMFESAQALLLEYPDALTLESLEEHIDDLLFRFQNKALGDTIFRVGRDLFRKLNRDDRILGAMRLAAKHSLSSDSILAVFYAACNFSALDENGNMFAKDKLFHNRYDGLSVEIILRNFSESTQL